MKEAVEKAIKEYSEVFNKVVGMKITGATVTASDNINEYNGKQTVFCVIDLLDLETGKPETLTIVLGDH